MLSQNMLQKIDYEIFGCVFGNSTNKLNEVKSSFSHDYKLNAFMADLLTKSPTYLLQ